jgi:crotonobetainyl-CoA:carnitine CoA-transferase CaiB-like acyl-CoA transferase
MKGVRVLDLTRVLAGPWASQQLADQGATVIKVEPPGGDETRQFGPFVDGESTYYFSANRNKRAICLDLKTEAGRAVLHRLLSQTDVVLENYRAGVAERLGLSWSQISVEFPRLIAVSIKAFGSDSDPRWSHRPGYDLVLQALGGAVSFTGFPESPPSKCGLSIADTLTGMLAVQAVLLALFERERSGAGQRIEINMMQAQAAALSYHATRFTMTGEQEERRGNDHRGLAPYTVYSCSDGLFAFACGNDRIWRRVVSTFNLPDRPEWRTNAGRLQSREAIDQILQRELRGLTLQEADQRCATADIPAGPVQTIAQALNHPAVSMTTVDHPTLGEVHMPGPFFQAKQTRTTHSAPPAFDEHRDQILETSGFDASEIQELAIAGAFGHK